MEDNSLESLTAFFEWCYQSYQNDTHTVPDLLHNLHKKAIPMAQNFRAKAIRAIKLALRSLILIIPHMELSCLKSKVDGHPGVIPGLVYRAWHGIWDWVSFLHTHCIMERSLGETLRIASLHCIPRALASFGWHAGLRKSMLETPGYLTIFLRHWEEECSYVSQPELAWDELYFCIALEQLLLYRDEDDNVVAAIVNATEGGAETVSRIALDQLLYQLQSVKKGGRMQLDSLCFDLTIIWHLSSGLSSAALRPLLCRGLAPTIATFLRLLRSRTSGLDEIPSVIDRAVAATFSIISTILFTSNGPAWVSQLIDAGLVPGILDSGLWLSNMLPDMPSSVSAGVFGHLQQYLVYRSVLRSVKKTLKDVKRMQENQVVSGTLWEGYLAFEKIASHRLEVKAMFDKEVALGLQPGFLGCDTREVSVQFQILKEIWIEHIYPVFDKNR